MKSEALKKQTRVPDANAIERFRDSTGVWLTFAGSAYYSLYRSRLAPLVMKPSWVTALAIIEQRPNITQSALGRELRINRASAMATCTQMEDAGLIVRTALSGRNQTGLTLTDFGRERLDASCRIEDGLAEALMEGIEQPDREVFVAVLRSVAERTASLK